MSRIKFIYQKNIFETSVDSKDSIEKAIEKYEQLISKEKNELLFLYEGVNILENKHLLKKLKKKKNILIKVFNKNKNYKKESENIICQDCSKLAFVNINEDKIDTNCIHKHKKNYSFKEFIESQYIDERGIRCDICKNNKHLYKDNFYLCSCKKRICELCKIGHSNNNHKLCIFSKRYSVCINHLNDYTSYCSQCNSNLCEECEKEQAHQNQKNKIVSYRKEMEKLNDKALKEEEKNIKEKILNVNKFKDVINNINYLFGILIEKLNNELDDYNKIYNKIILLSKNLNNYENIKNFVGLKNKLLNKDINKLAVHNVKNNFKYLTNQFNKFIGNISSDKLIDFFEPTSLIYKIKENQKKIQLFGHKFVEKNKDNFYLIIDNKIMNLCEYYYINDSNKKFNLKVMMLKNNNNVIDMSQMFYLCFKMEH